MALIFPAPALLEFTSDVFQACSAPPHEALIVADHLVTANLMGYDTHGLIRVPQYVGDIQNGVIKPGAPVLIEKETATTALVDCGWNFGQVGALRATEIAIERAARCNTSTVVAHRCNHVGRLGAYTMHAAERGFLALGVCNSPRHGHFVVPWGGREGRLATNPISFAVPCKSGPPILADFSTAEASEGAIRLCRNTGQSLPDGWIRDPAGRPSNAPADFYGPPRGAINPFGGARGYRGFALSLLVEILGGLLGGSRITAQQPGNGVAIIVVNIEAFIPAAEFEDMIAELREYIKSSPPAPGFDEVTLPGEPDFRKKQERSRQGIPIDENTWTQILDSAATVGVTWKSPAPVG
jgi:hydroxycarboxylate dehydrogenase B